MNFALSLLPFVLMLLCAPLLRNLIDKTKAYVGGREGPSWFQPYRDIRKFLSKGAVYSTTTSWVFRAAPVVSLAATLTASALVPFATLPAALHFHGDLLLFIALLAVAKMFVVLAALDTGSPFEGMGASREVTFGALAEPVMLLALAGLCRETGVYSLTDIYRAMGGVEWVRDAHVLLLVAAALFVVSLVENARIPVDDPTTHLELTMIHEVMVLDYSGPDFAFLEMAATFRLWFLSALVVGLMVPVEGLPVWVALPVTLVGMGLMGVLLGAVESGMARLRMDRVPDLIFGGAAFAVLSIILDLAEGFTP